MHKWTIYAYYTHHRVYLIFSNQSIYIFINISKNPTCLRSSISDSQFQNFNFIFYFTLYKFSSSSILLFLFQYKNYIIDVFLREYLLKISNFKIVNNKLRDTDINFGDGVVSITRHLVFHIRGIGIEKLRIDLVRLPIYEAAQILRGKCKLL